MTMNICACGQHCPAFDRATGTAAPLAASALPVCADCLRLVAHDVAALPGDYATLAAHLAPGRRELTARVSGTDDAAIPLALDVEALQREIVWTLTTWEAPVREVAGLSPERRGGVRDGWAVAEAARVIAPRVELLAALPPIWGYAAGLDAGPVLRDGAAAVLSLRALHRRARVVTGLTRLVHELPGECSGCGANALRRDDGADTVRCELCGRRWPWGDYERYVGLILAEYRR